METKRLYENSTYVGKRIEYSNGNKEWRDTQGKRVITYNKSMDTYRDGSNHVIKRGH